MKNLILGLILIISPFISFGHNPLSAKYHLEAGESASLLTINLSQGGVNQVLLKKYSKEELGEISQNELEELIVGYIKSNFSLSFDKKEVELEKGGIKLGSHQTDLKFVLPPLSNKLAEMDIHIPAFQENNNHQTIFSYNVEGRSDHVILSSRNDYQSTIMLSSSTTNTNSWMWYVAVGLISIVSMFLLKRSFKKTKSHSWAS